MTVLSNKAKRMKKLEDKLDSLGVDPNTINKMLTSIEMLTKEVKALKETERKKPHNVDYT